MLSNPIKRRKVIAYEELEVVDTRTVETKFLDAAKEGNVIALKDILSKDETIPDCVKITALQWASIYGHTPVVEELLKIKSVSENANRENNLALVEASLRGHVGVVRALLKNEKVSDNANARANIALMWASSSGYIEIVRILLMKPCVRNDLRGCFEALRAALINRHERMAKYIITHTKVSESKQFQHLLKIDQELIDIVNEIEKSKALSRLTKQVSFKDSPSSPPSVQRSELIMSDGCKRKRISIAPRKISESEGALLEAPRKRTMLG